MLKKINEQCLCDFILSGPNIKTWCLLDFSVSHSTAGDAVLFYNIFGNAKSPPQLDGISTHLIYKTFINMK